jgi:hypothetical protein
MAKSVSALKAVSHNLMHQNLTITNGVYGILSSQDINEQFGMLGNSNVGNIDFQELDSTCKCNRCLIEHFERFLKRRDLRGLKFNFKMTC